MTDEAVETPAEENKVQTFKDQLQELQFKSLDTMVVERNDLVGRANAANGDRVTLTEQIRENSQDPEIVKAREEMSNWALLLDKLVKPIVDKTIEDSAGSIKELEESIKEKDSVLKPGLNYYRKSYGDDAAEWFTKMARLQGATVRSGAGGRRIRNFIITVTLDGNDTSFDNFSSAAKFIGCDTTDLQREFFAKAGTEDSKKLPDEVSFVINYDETDADGNKTEKDAFVKATKQKTEESSDSDADDEADEPEVEDDSDTPDEDDIASAL